MEKCCETCKFEGTNVHAEPCCYCFDNCEKWEPNNNDPVNHPTHYAGKFECIDVMIEALGVDVVKGFCLGNAFKYLYRCKHKGNETEDIKKAEWYINKFLELDDEDIA